MRDALEDFVDDCAMPVFGVLLFLKLIGEADIYIFSLMRGTDPYDMWFLTLSWWWVLAPLVIWCIMQAFRNRHDGYKDVRKTYDKF